MKIIIIGFNNIVARHLIDMNIKNKIIIISRKKIFNNPNIIASYDYNDLFDKNKLKKIFNNVNIVINTIGNSINDSKMMEINYSSDSLLRSFEEGWPLRMIMVERSLM